MKLKKIASIFLALSAYASSACSTSSPASTTANSSQTGTTTTAASAAVTSGDSTPGTDDTAGIMRDMTTAEIVHEMGLGINLGNTFESCGSWISSSGGVKAYETGWGSPVITKEMIEGYVTEGFQSLRVPVAWSNLMAEDYTISAEYLDRVNEVIGWALDSGLYVVMNIHWDSGWWEKFPDEKDECMKKYTRIWEQLTEYYGNYGDKLIFESLNEEGCWDAVWNHYAGGDSEDKKFCYDLLNEINQKFVDIVRASGGNNEKRHLLIAGYNTDIDMTCDDYYKMPDDPAGRCAVSVHYYTPSTFCILEKDESWGKAKTEWGKASDIKQLEHYMDKIKERFADNGVPVIIGEYGCVAVKNKRPEEVRMFNVYAANAAYTRGMCPMLWDITDVFYLRNQHKMKDEKFRDSLARVIAGDGEAVIAELTEEKEAAKQAADEAAQDNAA